MKATDLEKILNELITDKNGHIRGKGRAMDKIQSLHLAEIQSEYVEKEFAIWFNDHYNESGEPGNKIYDYWLKEVKGVK